MQKHLTAPCNADGGAAQPLGPATGQIHRCHHHHRHYCYHCYHYHYHHDNHQHYRCNCHYTGSEWVHGPTVTDQVSHINPNIKALIKGVTFHGLRGRVDLHFEYKIV